MDIRQAINEAGPGGKICRKGMLGIVTIGEDALMENEQEVTNFGINNLTATDWQVITAERIEVGDVVRHCPDRNCEVRALSDVKIALEWIEGNSPAPGCICSRQFNQEHNSVKLIRKGSKPETVKDARVHLTCYPENDEIHLRFCKGDGFKPDTGKRYNVTFKEAE